MDLEINELVMEKINALQISKDRKKTIELLLENEITYGDSEEYTKQKISDVRNSVERGIRNENTSGKSQ